MSLLMTLHEFIWIDHLIALVICLVAPVMALSSRQVKDEEFVFEPEDKIRLYHSNALLLVVFALIVVTVWRVPGRALSGLGFTWPEWNANVMWLVLAIIFFYGMDFFFRYGTRKWRQRSLRQNEGAIQFVPVDFKELGHFLLLAVAAGVCEEIIFRGFLMNYLLLWTGITTTGVIASAICSSALFAFLHGYQGYVAMIKIFLLSLLFAGIFIMSKSLILVMIIHTLIDAISGWLGIYLLKEMKTSETPEQEN